VNVNESSFSCSADGIFTLLAVSMAYPCSIGPIMASNLISLSRISFRHSMARRTSSRSLIGRSSRETIPCANDRMSSRSVDDFEFSEAPSASFQALISSSRLSVIFPVSRMIAPHGMAGATRLTRCSISSYFSTSSSNAHSVGLVVRNSAIAVSRSFVHNSEKTLNDSWCSTMSPNVWFTMVESESTMRWTSLFDFAKS
jgi:hypothetical protein